MPDIASINIDASQFPDAVQSDLFDSLRSRQVNHKFHYDSVKQTQRWLALHQVFSPSRHDAECRTVYEQGFQAVTGQIQARRVHLIGLGCGGGQKDSRLAGLLNAAGKEVYYSPCDVSTAMVLVAWQAVQAALPTENCYPFVCDLASAKGLGLYFQRNTPPNAVRLLTFFGMLPNFAPAEILPKLAELLRPQDYLLMSANLAPGPDYDAGMTRVLPQYDNPPTREWLLTFLLDLGVDRSDGELRFSIEEDAEALKQIVARFHFTAKRRIEIGSQAFVFSPGDIVRLFFSYRYTPERVRAVITRLNLTLLRQWITPSEEEGVFLVQRG